eukprot:3849521-Amphidinium_carterae.1
MQVPSTCYGFVLSRFKQSIGPQANNRLELQGVKVYDYVFPYKRAQIAMTSRCDDTVQHLSSC